MSNTLLNLGFKLLFERQTLSALPFETNHTQLNRLSSPAFNPVSTLHLSFAQ